MNFWARRNGTRQRRLGCTGASAEAVGAHSVALGVHGDAAVVTAGVVSCSIPPAVMAFVAVVEATVAFAAPAAAAVPARAST